MANFTQGQCDAITSLKTEKHYESDGTTFSHYFVRAYDQNGEYYEFVDSVSAANASPATRKTNAHTFLIANCAFKTVAVSTKDAEEDIL